MTFTRSKTSLFSESSHSHYSSQPRLHSKLSTSSSPICMTGNMQLSQKYKSSADLVSELLKKPVFTRYRSIKKKSGSYGPRSSDMNSNLAVIRAETECPPPLESVNLVRSLQPAKKGGELDVSMVEVQTVQMV